MQVTLAIDKPKFPNYPHSSALTRLGKISSHCYLSSQDFASILYLRLFLDLSISSSQHKLGNVCEFNVFIKFKLSILLNKISIVYHYVSEPSIYLSIYLIHPSHTQANLQLRTQANQYTPEPTPIQLSPRIHSNQARQPKRTTLVTDA